MVALGSLQEREALAIGAPLNRFSGQTVLVTGGSAGIGRAAALAFPREGADVVMASRSEAGNLETIRQIEAAGGRASFVPADMARSADLRRLFSHIEHRYGRLDCAFNNAAQPGPEGSILDCTEEDWDALQAVNVRSVLVCMQHEIRLMLRQGRGCIVNTASVAGLIGERATALYCATKHAVLGLTRSAALELADRGIRINAVCPGPIGGEDTAQVLAKDADLERRIQSRVPMRRVGRAEEVAAAVLWLCSEESTYATGLALPIDGGICAGR